MLALAALCGAGAGGIVLAGVVPATAGQVSPGEATAVLVACAVAAVGVTAFVTRRAVNE